MIRKIRIKGKVYYRVVSKRTGRNMGTYRKRGLAVRRLEQIEYFKHRARK